MFIYCCSVFFGAQVSSHPLISRVVQLLPQDGLRGEFVQRVDSLCAELVQHGGTVAREHAHVVIGGQAGKPVGGAQVPIQYAARFVGAVVGREHAGVGKELFYELVHGARVAVRLVDCHIGEHDEDRPLHLVGVEVFLDARAEEEAQGRFEVGVRLPAAVARDLSHRLGERRTLVQANPRGGAAERHDAPPQL